MSVAHRRYWFLVNEGRVQEFIRWVRDEYPITFKLLMDQYMKQKGGG